MPAAASPTILGATVVVDDVAVVVVCVVVVSVVVVKEVVVVVVRWTVIGMASEATAPTTFVAVATIIKSPFEARGAFVPPTLPLPLPLLSSAASPGYAPAMASSA